MVKQLTSGKSCKLMTIVRLNDVVVSSNSTHRIDLTCVKVSKFAISRDRSSLTLMVWRYETRINSDLLFN